MKFFTKNIVLFALTFAVLTILFRIVMSYFLIEGLYTYSTITAIAYSIGAFSAGWVFGKREHEGLDWFDIGFRFHLCTYLIFGTVSEIWFALGNNAPSETPKVLHLTLVIWGIAVVVHFIFFLITRKSSIKGINKKDVF